MRGELPQVKAHMHRNFINSKNLPLLLDVLKACTPRTKQEDSDLTRSPF